MTWIECFKVAHGIKVGRTLSEDMRELLRWGSPRIPGPAVPIEDLTLFDYQRYF